MPLVHISLRSGKPEAYRQAVFDDVYRALHETFGVPEDDQFMAIHEHEPGNFRYGGAYLGIKRSDDVIFIQITVSNWRTVDQKKALFARLVDLLHVNPGVRKEDVLISLVEVAKENWSLGNGLQTYA